MAVKVNKRKKSVIQYIDTANDLFKHTLSCCSNFPKSLMFLFTKDIVRHAREVYCNVVMANEIYPKSKLDVELRYKYLTKAKSHISSLDGLLSVASEVYVIKKVSNHAWEKWGKLMVDEKRLISAVINSDRKLGY